MRYLKELIISASILWMGSNVAHAANTFIVNNTDSTLLVSVATEGWFSFTVKGHYWVEPGDSLTFYQVDYEWKHYAVYTKGEHHQPYKARSKQRVGSFCIKSSVAFEYQVKKRSDLNKPCRSGFERVETSFSARGGDNNATMNLN